MSPNLVEESRRIFRFITDSRSLEELCQRLIYSPQLNGVFIGAAFFKIEKNNRLLLEASCGDSITENQAELLLSIGKRPPLLLDSRPSYKTLSGMRVLVFPILQNSVPTEFLTIKLSPEIVEDPVSLEALEIVQSASGLVHDYLPISFPRSRELKPLPPGFALSPRHKTIISLIKDGRTNEQIGKELSLSASIIRQENVKIFKFFGVSSRRALEQVSIPD